MQRELQLLGSRPHELLAGYLRHAHVGIVPFSFTRHGELIREVSPLKVFEYSACGLPVVGTQGCQYPSDLAHTIERSAARPMSSWTPSRPPPMAPDPNGPTCRN